MEPMSSISLDQAIRDIHPIGTITRAAAKAKTPVTNGVAYDITGVDEVTIHVGETKTTHFQCVFCGEVFPSPASGRSHLVVHSNDKQTTMRDARTISDAILNGKSIYAPYDTDDENVTFMLRVMDANTPAVRKIQREARQGGRKMGQSSVPTDDLKTLKAKADAYDALKAQTLKSQFPV
jgi:hypothetical protein